MPRIATGGSKRIEVSEDFKNKLLDLYDNQNINTYRLAERFHLSASYISRLIKTQRKKNVKHPTLSKS